MENAKYILQNNASWTSNCDSKVSYVLTVNGVILTIIMTSENSKYLYNTLRYSVASKFCDFSVIINFLEFVSLLSFLVLILISFIYAFSALRARIDPSKYSTEKALNESNIFWGTISNKTFDDYKNIIQCSNNDSLKDDLINQVYITSKICKTKFKYYNSSLKYTAIAYICLILYVIIKVKVTN